LNWKCKNRILIIKKWIWFVKFLFQYMIWIFYSFLSTIFNYFIILEIESISKCRKWHFFYFNQPWYELVFFINILDNLAGHSFFGSLTGAVYLGNDSQGHKSETHRERKSRVEFKCKQFDLLLCFSETSESGNSMTNDPLE